MILGWIWVSKYRRLPRLLENVKLGRIFVNQKRKFSIKCAGVLKWVFKNVQKYSKIFKFLDADSTFAKATADKCAENLDTDG